MMVLTADSSSAMCVGLRSKAGSWGLLYPEEAGLCGLKSETCQAAGLWMMVPGGMSTCLLFTVLFCMRLEPAFVAMLLTGDNPTILVCVRPVALCRVWVLRTGTRLLLADHSYQHRPNALA